MNIYKPPIYSLRAQNEELAQISRDQENGYDVIRPPNDNGSYGATYEELKHRKEEHGYEKLSDPTIIFNNEKQQNNLTGDGKQQNKTGLRKQSFGPPTTQSNRQSQHFEDYLSPI
ncbi:uncharacterized protein LOC134280062 [Saccostrea cucullata]|uniref:uncharacterized protein LOC134280062 n=1 Tax=Saccostrea cuccullata TaxID=36930 RepID=UPI002ED1E5A9